MRLLNRIWYVLIAALFLPQVASAQSSRESVFTDAFNRLRNVSGQAGIESSQTPAQLVGNVVNVALGILGLVALGLILYAGGLWLTAAGNDDKVSDAKKIIRTTVVGIIIVGLAYAITAFIISLVVTPA